MFNIYTALHYSTKRKRIMKQTLDRKFLFILIMTVFLDICNFFMPVPVYTPLFLQHGFLPHVSYANTVILLGVLVSCFGAAQLIGGPILGELSDQYGRKKILMLALITGMMGTLLGAISLTTGSLPLVYISRLIIGFSSGTIGVSYAVAADFSTPKDLAKNIGIISLGPCFASAFAPIIGGHLASNKYFAVFGFATPFYFMAVLFLITIVMLYRLMPADNAKREKSKINPVTGIVNIFKVVRRSSVLRRMVVMAIFFQIGTEGFFLASPIVAVKEYHMTASSIGNHFLLFAIGSSIATWLNNRISKHFESTSIYVVCLSIMIVAFAFAYSGQPILYWIAYLLFGAGGMMCWVHTNNIFSGLVDETEQGLIMGVSQAMWSIGGLTSAIIVGFIASVHYKATGILLISTEIASLIMMFMVIRAMRGDKAKATLAAANC
jgi:predicted MFS family arabinose efflux permease